MPKVKITNHSAAPQGFYERVPDMPEGVDASRPGTFIAPGDTKTLDLTDVHLKHARMLGPRVTIEVLGDDVEVDDDGPVADLDDFDRMSDDELKTFISERDGRNVHPATGRAKLLANARGTNAEEAV